MEIMDIKSNCDNIKNNIKKVIVGKESIIELLLTSLISNGHVLLEDVPGTGKTLLAKSFAASLHLDFKRIQFTPDLLPSDITGLNVYNPKNQEFNFIKGPAFSNVILADEINRATPRTQSSLLECMEEGQITTDGTTRKLRNPYIIIATENPVETAGTYPLPEAQLDRFLMKLSMGLPSNEDELEIINRFSSINPLDSLKPVCTPETILDMSNSYGKIFVHDEVKKYIIAIINATRHNEKISLGVSPRGTLSLFKACKALAAIRGYAYVTPDDVKYLAPFVLSHRIILVNNYSNYKNNIDIINDILKQVTVPTENWDK